MDIIAIGVLYLSTLGYLLYNQSFQKKAEIERLREVVRAIKSKNAIQYEEVLPPLDTIKYVDEVKDELVDLSEIEPAQLLRSLKQ